MPDSNITYTPHLNLSKLPANHHVWAQIMNDNLTILDGAVSGFVIYDNWRGAWTNSTSYAVGDTVVDLVTALVWTAQVDHISAPVPKTFVQDQAFHPTYWTTANSPATKRGAWMPNTAYSVNDFVLADGTKYAMCMIQHVSGPVFDDDAALGRWTVLVDFGLSSSSVAVGSTPPNPPITNQMWWNSDIGHLFIWYNDGNSSQWVPATPISEPETGSSNTVTVANLSSLKALAVPLPDTALNNYRTSPGDQGGGEWAFRIGDQTANVNSDTQSGLWAAPDFDPTGFTGAWQRLFNGDAYLDWFGAQVGTATDQSPIINAAITACEFAHVGVLKGTAGVYRCDSKISIGRNDPISLEGPGIAHRYGTITGTNITEIMCLDFTSAPALTVGVEIAHAIQTSTPDGSGGWIVNQRDGGGLRCIYIRRSAPQAAGAGGIGVLIKAVINLTLEDIVVEGFDVNMKLTVNSDPTAGTFPVYTSRFINIATRLGGNYGVWAESIVGCKFDDCWFLGATIAGFFISRPAVLPANTNIVSNGNYFSSCVFIGTQGTAPTYCCQVDSGFGNWFNQCVFEGPATGGVGFKAKLTTGGLHSGLALAVQLSDCWFNVDNGQCCMEMDDCNFVIVNSRLYNHSTSSDGVIRVGMEGTLAIGLGYNSSIIGCHISYRGTTGVEVGTYDMLKIADCGFYDFGTLNTPSVIMGAGSARNIFHNNTMKTTHATGWTNSGTGNVFKNNIVSPANTITDSDYRFSMDSGGALTLTGAINGTSLTLTGALAGVTATFSSQVQITRTDNATCALFRGSARAARFVPTATVFNIEGVDQTGVGSFQPLSVNGSELRFGTPTEAMRLDTTGLGIGIQPAISKVHVKGPGQVGATQDTGATLGATVYVQDSLNAVGNGGVVQFGASQGAFCAIKGYIGSATGNTTGDMVFMTRRLGADATLSEAFRILAVGNMTTTLTPIINNTVAIGAPSATQALIRGSSTTNFGIYYGNTVPGALSAGKGSLYINTTATTTTTRLYINTDGATTWTNLTTAA